MSLFFPSRAHISLCFLRPGPSNARAWALGLQTFLFEGPGASNTTKTTKIPREDKQRERKKKAKMGMGEGKKREIWGSPPFGLPFGLPPPFQTFSRFGPLLPPSDLHPPGPPPSGPPLFLGLGSFPPHFFIFSFFFFCAFFVSISFHFFIF